MPKKKVAKKKAVSKKKPSPEVAEIVRLTKEDVAKLAKSKLRDRLEWLADDMLDEAIEIANKDLSKWVNAEVNKTLKKDISKVLPRMVKDFVDKLEIEIV